MSDIWLKHINDVELQWRSHPERANLDVMHKTMENDIALMRQSRHPIHVGIWLDIDGGGMLHCMQGADVVFKNLHHFTSAGKIRPRTKFFQCCLPRNPGCIGIAVMLVRHP